MFVFLNAISVVAWLPFGNSGIKNGRFYDRKYYPDRIINMKRQLIVYFVISLGAELGTTWMQKYGAVTDVYPGLYYPNFKALLLDRLLTWFIIFIMLIGIWRLIVRCISTN